MDTERHSQLHHPLPALGLGLSPRSRPNAAYRPRLETRSAGHRRFSRAEVISSDEGNEEAIEAVEPMPALLIRAAQSASHNAQAILDHLP